MKYTDSELTDIYNRNIDMLYKICYTYFKGNKSMIEDAIQNIFLNIIKKKIMFQDKNHEKAWMIRSIKNECLNVLNKKDNQNVEIDFEIAESNKIDETLQKVLNLPGMYKLPIYLFYYENYSAVEIAEILDTNVNTIYSYLNRGREYLKLEIEGEL